MKAIIAKLAQISAISVLIRMVGEKWEASCKIKARRENDELFSVCLLRRFLK